jgi:hypothetical protein
MPRQFERLWWCVLAVLMGLTNAWGQSSTLHLYDNFDADFLNPAKWSGNWNCGTALDCVRDIEDDELRFKVRGYGATDSSDGTQYGPSTLNLTKSNVTDIAVQLVVRRSSADGCSTNPGFGGGGGHAHFLVVGNFFNGGGGTTDDDVTAYLQLDRYSTYPAGQVLVGGFLRYQNQFFGNVDLEYVNIGEKVTVELVWDQPNHRFVIRLTRPSQGTVTKQYMPYSVSDVTPAVGAFKSLSANVYPANCLGTRKSATLDVAVTKVMTN